MKVKVYVHSSKDSMWDKGVSLGLESEALRLFSYALCEVEFVLDVNADGTYKIVTVDGKAVSE